MGFVVSMGEPMDLGVKIGVNEEFGRCEGSGTTDGLFQNSGSAQNVNPSPLSVLSRMLESAGVGFARDAQKLANKQRAERQHFKGFRGSGEAEAC